MKLLLLILTLLACSLCFSQNVRIFYTDSSVIQIEQHFSGSITTYERVKDKNFVYYSYLDKNGLLETGKTNNYKEFIGTWFLYDQNGDLIKMLDFDKNTFQIFKKELYPYMPLLEKTRAKADSLVIASYGIDFFRKHVKWNISNTWYVFNDGSGNSWTDTTTRRPDHFVFKYDVKLDHELFKGFIRFELDVNGNYIGSKGEFINGFEKRPVKSVFNITYDKALAVAKQMGLTETDSTKALGYLNWECFRTNEFYNGYYRYYILFKKSEIKDLKNGRRSSITEKFDVYSFDPWTGEFLEKKKMKTITSWERHSGNSTGLIPDD